jgi:hypothetical protein
MPIAKLYVPGLAPDLDAAEVVVALIGLKDPDLHGLCSARHEQLVILRKIHAFGPTCMLPQAAEMEFVVVVPELDRSVAGRHGQPGMSTGKFHRFHTHEGSIIQISNDAEFVCDRTVIQAAHDDFSAIRRRNKSFFVRNVPGGHL